jgi:uncharacterized protein (DUF2132 family)
MEDSSKIREEQPKNPLHGVKLVDILEYLHAVYGWEELGYRIQIRTPILPAWVKLVTTKKILQI